MSEEEKKDETIEEFKKSLQRELIYQTVESAASVAFLGGDVNSFMTAICSNAALLICHCKDPARMYQQVCRALRIAMLEHRKTCDEGEPFTAADLIGTEKPLTDEELAGTAGATNEILERAFHGRG